MCGFIIKLIACYILNKAVVCTLWVHRPSLRTMSERIILLWVGAKNIHHIQLREWRSAVLCLQLYYFSHEDTTALHDSLALMYNRNKGSERLVMSLLALEWLLWSGVYMWLWLSCTIFMPFFVLIIFILYIYLLFFWSSDSLLSVSMHKLCQMRLEY